LSEHKFSVFLPNTIGQLRKPNLTIRYLQNETLFFTNPVLKKKNLVLSTEGFYFTAASLNFLYNHEAKTLFFTKTNDETVEAYILGPVIALIGAFQGFVPLHAAGVKVNNLSWLIVGRSGTGKSTLLYELMRNYSATFFSDDLVFTVFRKSRVQAMPSFPFIKLWEDAILRFKASKQKAVHHKINKYYLEQSTCFVSDIQQPSVILVLQTSTQSTTSYEEIKGTKKFLYLQQNVYRKPWIEALFKENVFFTLTALSKQCRMFVVRRPLLTNAKIWSEMIQKLINELNS